MTFLAPIFFYVALGVAAGAVALHFIVTRQPTSSPLPTVRFIPTSQVRVTTVAPLPEDLLLLLVRVLAILLIGAALARPVIVPHRRPLAHVVLADVSRAVGSIDAVRDSARSLLKEGDVLVVFDSAARVVQRGAADSAAHLARTAREGRLSPALIAALRTASKIRDAADSIELAIVSPLRAGEMDGSTQAIRALWPGRVRLVRVPAASDSLAPPAGIAVRAGADDPIALAASVNGIPRGDSTVRVARGTVTAADSTWAASGRHTLVRWPATGAPPGWVARARVDTASAVVAGEAALVFPLERRWMLDSTVHATRVAARWVDGVPAAVERGVGEGCIRDVAIPVPTRGDLVLRPAFARFVRALVAPCEVVSGGLGADSTTLRALAGDGALASHDAIRAPEIVATPLVPWLLAAALLFVL
ncbi:MAG TPA: BatA domain-containing protein, partial [Gemmatimonadaceae bacterium]|nr:BatA domain-containing protein [Gemmatimonadaceae bacterium]